MYAVKEAALKMGYSERHVRFLLKHKQLAGKKWGRDWIVTSLVRKPKEKVGRPSKRKKTKAKSRAKSWGMTG